MKWSLDTNEKSHNNSLHHRSPNTVYINSLCNIDENDDLSAILQDVGRLRKENKCIYHCSTFNRISYSDA